MIKISELAHIPRNILSSSAYLSMKQANSPSAIEIMANRIAEDILASYKLEKKDVWYGVDLDQRIKELKKDLAIAYSMKKRHGNKSPEKKSPIEIQDTFI